MSLAYHAAEYFVEAIGQSPSLSISYDYMRYLTGCVEGEIQRYLNDNGKDDIFFIFRKFPDVFRIKNGAISLTDAFLSIYALKRSTAPKGIKSSSSIKDYYENAAVTFFNTMISRYGPQHYLTLFHSLVTQSNQMIASYFSRYTSSHAYSFFLSHADAFVVKNCFVSLNIQSLINAQQQNTYDSPTVVKELTDSVYFLLTCFESLHYIELKQCISYVSKGVKCLLDQYSLIKQRRMFETLPNVEMDNYGFISLLDLNVNISISDDTKMMLLFVCILTFERELHFQKMVSNIASGRSFVVKDLCNLPIDEQLQFFKSKSKYFYTTDRGYISLLPSFMCPICSFEGLTKHVKKNQSYVKSESLYASPEVCDKSKKDSFEGLTKHVENHQSYVKSEVYGKSGKDSNLVDKKFEEIEDILSSKLNEIQQKANASIIKVWTEMLNVDVPEERKRQFIVSILFLSEVVEQIEHKCVLKTLLYVFYDVRISFDNLSKADKHDFITSCCKILNSELIKTIQLNQLLMKEIAEEKILLFVTYLLAVKLRIHFEKISKEIIVKNIVPLSSKISNQYKFFKNFSVLIEIGGNGYVNLAESFDSVNSTIESYTNLISQHWQKNTVIQDKSRKCVPKAEAAESNVVIQPSSSSKNSISPTANKRSRRSRSKSQTPSTDSKLKQDLLQKLNYSSFLIRMHFQNALDSHIIEAYLLTFRDAYKFFCELSFEDRYNFIQECFQLIKSSNDQLQSDNCCNKTFSQDLLWSYLILREKVMHYQKIVTNLKNMNADAILCNKAPSEQFKYFKTFSRYLEINGDGFVTLNSSFNEISSIINSVISFESRKSFKCKPVTEQKQPSGSSSRNAVRQVDLCAQGLKIAIENADQSKNSPKKEDIQNWKMAQVNTTCAKNNDSHKKEIVQDSPNNLPSQNECNIKDVITDLCVFILSTCEKVSIEKLSCKLSSYDLRDVKNFSLLTYPEKLDFFKNLSEYFTVSVDGFVSLKENVPNTYIPKTKTSPSDVHCDNISASEESTNCAVQNKSEHMSTDFLISVEKEKNSSCSKGLKSYKSHCTESSSNECSNNFIEKRKSAESLLDVAVIMPGEAKNGSLAEQEQMEVTSNSVSKNETTNFPSTSVTSKDTPVINISGPKIPKSGLDHESVEDIFKACIESTPQSFESNSSDTNSEKVSKFKNKKKLLNIDNFKMSLDYEPNISRRKSLEQIRDDFTHKDEKCTDYVLTMASSFANLSLNDSGEHDSTPLSQGIKYNSVNSVFQNTKCFEVNESNIFLDNTVHKMCKLSVNYNSTRSIFDKISSSNENKLSTETKSSIGATKKQTVKDCSGLSSKSFQRDAFNSKILPCAEEIIPSLSTGNRKCNNSSLSDLCDDAYIAEIIDSYLGISKKEPVVRKSSYFKNASLNQNFQTVDTIQCSNNGSKLHDANSFSSDCQTQNDQNLIERVLVSNKLQCNSVPNNLDCLTSVNSINLSECRAVNFFCVMLENYENSKEGVPIELLKENLRLASSEVQSFMHSHFKDMLSFFRKHKSVFSVLPCSNISLV